MRRWLRVLSCWWAGHEPRSVSWVSGGIEESTCRYCGREIERDTRGGDDAVREAG